MVESLCGEDLRDFVGMGAALRQEVLLGLVSQDVRHEVVELTGCSEEHLSLAILRVFLNVERDAFGDAEVFHGLGDGEAHVFCYHEEVVDGVP